MKILATILTVIITVTVSLAQTESWTYDSTAIFNLVKANCDKYNRKHRNKELIRTSDNDTILQKYIKIYEFCGGRQYIISLQQNFKLKQLNDTTYYIKIKEKGSLQYEDGTDWTHFLMCPIGKPDGKVILIDGDGNERFEFNYKNEMKHGEARTEWGNLKFEFDKEISE